MNGPELTPAVLGRRLCVLGATGSVGGATLDLVAQARRRYGAQTFPVEALTAQSNVEALADAALSVGARAAVIADPSRYAALKARLSGSGIEAAAGAEALVEAAQRPSDWVMAAIVGAAGLAPTLAATRRGALVALANKEALVCAGEVLTEAARAAGARLLPVDSEHNAIFQVIEAAGPGCVEKITLTASGGPFRDWPLDRMATVSPEQAVAHPVWSMGAKISVDSATLMNKGLELIEAMHLFDIGPERLDVLVHPQSLVHSLVSCVDGSVLAQLGAPDMRIPIASALAWPTRLMTSSPRLDLAAVGTLTFERPDEARFPCLRLAREAMSAAGGAAVALNAANEIAVARFLDRRLSFLDIPRVVEAALEDQTRRLDSGRRPLDLDAVLALDAAARRAAETAASALV